MENEQKLPGRTARGALRLIHGYQHLRQNRLSPCRFTPSCSSYAEEAIEVHGAIKGVSLAIWRVLRCNPFGGHGVDLVPLNTGSDR